MRRAGRVLIAAITAVMTAPLVPAPAVARESAAPCPALAGRRLSQPVAGVYLVDAAGYRRGIPNPTTYLNLFRDWNGLTDDPHMDLCETGEGISDGAILITAAGRPVFLLTAGVRHGITSPAIMDKYYFNWDKVQTVPVAALDALPEGPIWE